MRLDMKSGKTVPVLATKDSEFDPNISPDGEWLAYSSDATGENQVYLMSLAGGEAPRIRLSPKGGVKPQWRRDGREIVYYSGDAITSASPGPSGRWDDATIHELFRVPDLQRYAVLPDAQSFLIQRGSPGAADSIIHVVLGLQ